MAVLKNINFKVSNSWVDAGSLTYPVGSVYSSTSPTSPATLFGGTWSQIKDRFLVGVGDSYSVKATGGENTHTLTVKEIPSHKHSTMEYQSGRVGENGSGSQDGLVWGTKLSGTWKISTTATGEGGHTTTSLLTTRSTSGSEQPSKCGDVVCHPSSTSWMLSTLLDHITSQKIQHRQLHSSEELGVKSQTGILKVLHQQARLAVKIPSHLACSISQVLSGQQMDSAQIPLKLHSIMRAAQDMVLMLRRRGPQQHSRTSQLIGQSICGTAQPRILVGGAC